MTLPKNFIVEVEAYAEYDTEEIKRDLESAIWIAGLSGFKIKRVREKVIEKEGEKQT